jgi:hypothetical protein
MMVRLARLDARDVDDILEKVDPDVRPIVLEALASQSGSPSSAPGIVTLAHNLTDDLSDWLRACVETGEGLTPAAHAGLRQALHETKGSTRPKPALKNGQALPFIRRLWQGSAR